eukprot:9492582-Pyramimonas_sp.AAC.2
MSMEQNWERQSGSRASFDTSTRWPSTSWSRLAHGLARPEMHPSSAAAFIAWPLMAPNSAPKNFAICFRPFAACCSRRNLLARSSTSARAIFQCAKTSAFVSDRALPS